MNKNRYLLCLLVCGMLLYYAVPRLGVLNSGLEGIFAISWLAFALFVIAGNLTALLFSPSKGTAKPKRKQLQSAEKKVRSFYR